MAAIKDPTFTTEAGKVFKLRPVNEHIKSRWQLEWTRRYPAPIPPVQMVVIGLQETSQPNTSDPHYLEQYQLWNTWFMLDVVDYTLSRGVIDMPPKEWKPDPETIGANPTEQQLKAVWIEEQLMSQDELTGLIEAINSLSGVTKKGLEESEKN